MFCFHLWTFQLLFSLSALVSFLFYQVFINKLQSLRERKHSWEIACQTGLRSVCGGISLINDWCGRAHPTVGDVSPGQVVQIDISVHQLINSVTETLLTHRVYQPDTCEDSEVWSKGTSTRAQSMSHDSKGQRFLSGHTRVASFNKLDTVKAQSYQVFLFRRVLTPLSWKFFFLR